MKYSKLAALVGLGLGSCTAGYCVRQEWIGYVYMLSYGPAIIHGVIGGWIARNYMQRPLAPEASIKDYKNQEGNIVRAGVIGGAVIGGLETALGYGVAFAVEFLHKV